MKTQRQAKILEIIAEQDVETQEQLLGALRANGYSCTQATISRDIKELRIVKELSGAGAYRYTASSGEAAETFSVRLNTIFHECVTSIEAAQNLVIIKTLPGLASAACSAIDGMSLHMVVGTLAGDDTGLLIMRDTASAAGFCAEIKKLVD